MPDSHDAQRLDALRRYAVLDTPAEPDFDDLAELARVLCDAPIALVSLVDEHRQWFKAEKGLGVRETPISESVCACVMREPGPVQIPDLRSDPRSATNRLVLGEPHLRFYAGAPLRTADGFVLGMLCVLDYETRTLSERQLNGLVVLARQVVTQLETRRNATLLAQHAEALTEVLRAKESAEAKLRRSEEEHRSIEAMLHAIGDSTDAFIYAKDLHGRVIYCNEAVLRSIGRQREEVIGRKDSEFLPPSPATDAILEHDEQVLREGRTRVFRESLEGLGRTYLSTKAPFRGGNGQLIGLVGVSIDITELEKTRQALADVEERASMAAEAAEIGIYDWDPRADRLVWSDALRRQFGMDLAQEVSVQVALERIHPDDRDRVAEAIQRAMDPDGDGDYNIEYRTVPLGDSPRWLHVLGRVRFEEREGSRQAVRFFGVSVNITKQKELETALRFQLDLTRSITDNATTAVLMMDERGRCTFMNPAAEKMTGYALQEVQGGLLHDFIHHHRPDGRAYPVQECPIDRVLPEQLEVVEHEDMFVRKNGEFFPVIVNAKPLRKEGLPAGTVIEVRDVTVEREALQRLRELSASLAEADRRKDEFLATLAHELRNPLAPVRAAASLLTIPQLPPQRIGWAAEVIQRQVGQMAKLLDDLLDVARITRGKLTINREAVALSDVVEAAVESARPLMEERNHELKVELPSGGPSVRVDRVRISQILVNLLTNAARYTPEGGRIGLRAEVAGSEVVLSVSDNGAGLSHEELSRVFSMFGQGHAGSRTEGGLGIGLALSRSLAQLHGGELTAFSEGPGHGSVFELRLPNALCEGATESPRPQPSVPSSRLRVLIADDNRDAADALAARLELEGYETRAVYGGRDALELARSYQPEAVVLDIGMPDITGYEVARLLRHEAWARNALLVAVTGWGQKADKELARHSGFDVHLTKPADTNELCSILREWATEDAVAG